MQIIHLEIGNIKIWTGTFTFKNLSMMVIFSCSLLSNFAYLILFFSFFFTKSSRKLWGSSSIFVAVSFNSAAVSLILTVFIYW